MFYCQAVVSMCCISTHWLQVISRHQMSVSQFSKSNTYPTQFKLILLTVVVGTFPFFDVWFNVVQLASIVFLFSLPLRASSHPNSQVVVCTTYSCRGYPWHIYCFCCLFISFNYYVCRDFTQSGLFFPVMERCQYVIHLI